MVWGKGPLQFSMGYSVRQRHESCHLHTRYLCQFQAHACEHLDPFFLLRYVQVFGVTLERSLVRRHEEGFPPERRHGKRWCFLRGMGLEYWIDGISIVLAYQACFSPEHVGRVMQIRFWRVGSVVSSEQSVNTAGRCSRLFCQTGRGDN